MKAHRQSFICLREKRTERGRRRKVNQEEEEEESDHQPIEIEIKEKSEQREVEEEKLEIEIEDRSEDGIRKFRKSLKNVSFEREGVQEGLRELVEKIREAVIKK